jgi:hypothetical protein
MLKVGEPATLDPAGVMNSGELGFAIGPTA